MVPQVSLSSSPEPVIHLPILLLCACFVGICIVVGNIAFQITNQHIDNVISGIMENIHYIMDQYDNVEKLVIWCIC